MKSQKQSSQQSSQSSQQQSKKKSKRPHTCIGASCPVCKASQDGREAREYARHLAQTAPKAAAAAVWGGLRWEQLPPVPRRLRRKGEKPMRDASILAMFGASQVRFGSDRLAAALKDLALMYGEQLPGDAVPKWTAPGCDSRREGTMRLLFDRLQAELEDMR